MDNKLLRIWLAGKTSGATWRAGQLEDCFGSIEAVYNAKMEDYMQIAEMTKSVAIALCDKGLDGAKTIISDCEKLGINILTVDDECYPKVLTEISSPVHVLYTLGKIPDWDSILGIAVVGTRHNTEYGQTVTERISRELAEKGVTIISGMAAGVDSFALKSALRVGAPTIAVMGRGLDEAYPPENQNLMNEIIKTGCAISEYPPYSPPLPQHFPARNRIVSALSNGVLATEAPKRSGTLITTRLARDMGKVIFAVPGNIFAGKSVGTNNLIKQGANAVTCGKDILDAFPIRVKNLTPPEIKAVEVVEEVHNETESIDGLGEEENKIITLLREKDMHIEELAAKSNLTIAELNKILPMLEIEGYIIKQAGSQYKYNV
ncbi:MAG: DNA-processing protein DprA [Eubacteriales bacterium]|nr:DNA-processing protein DprA [Eubacteriales bacterium]